MVHNSRFDLHSQIPSHPIKINLSPLFNLRDFNSGTAIINYSSTDFP